MYRFAKIAFASILLPIIVGIAIGYELAPINLITTLILFSVVICFLCVGLIFCKPPYRQYVLLGSLMICFFTISWLQTSRTLARIRFAWFEQEQTYQLQLTTLPEQREQSIRCEAHIIALLSDDTLQTVDRTVLVTFPKDSLTLTLQRGDILLARTVVVNPNKGNPEEFDYNDYLRQHGLSGTAYIPSNAWERTAHQPVRTLKAYAENCQQYLSNYFSHTGIKGDEWGVICALTLGNRDGLDTDIKQHYSASGAMHVLAVSGLHVGILYGALLFLLTGFGLFPVQYAQKKRRIANMAFLLVALWAYAFLTGLSASVMRSALMFSLLTIGHNLDRETSTFNTLAASASIILLLHPLMLYSTSFVLSYSAVAAIVGIQPTLQALLHIPSRFLRWIWGLVTVSVAAQWGTIAWTLYWFSQTSNWFILTNIVVIPMASVIIYTAIAVLLAAPFYPLACLLAKVLNIEAWLLNHYVEWIEALPFSTCTLSLSKPMLCCLCITVVCASLAFVLKNKYWLFLALLSLLGLLCCDISRTRKIQQQDELIIYNTYNANILFHQQGRTGVILTDDSASAMQWTKNLRQKRCIKNTKMVDISQYPLFVFRYADKEYILVRDSLFEDYGLTIPEKTDYLLLGDIGRVSPDKIMKQFEPEKLVLMPTLKRWKAQRIMEIAQEQNIPCYDIRKKALVLSLDSANHCEQ